jgi:hypothetical protein
MSEWIYIKGNERHSFFGEMKYRSVSATEREVELVVKPDASLGFELALSGLGIDGSRSMLRPFGAHLPKMLRKKNNKVHPVAQELAGFLARNSRNKCAVAYWACGDDGGAFEPVGIMSADEIQAFEFQGPQNWGGSTKLAPLVEFFWDEVFAEVDKAGVTGDEVGGAGNTGIAVILTDGAWDDEDHQRLLHLTDRMCREIAAGKRRLMKAVVLGLKTEENKGEIPRIDQRLNDINNYEAAEDIDIWYANWVDEMEDWGEIFIELVKDWSLGIGGFVEAQGKQVLQSDEFTFGIQFRLPASCNSFKLHLNEVGEYEQKLV